MFLGLRLLLLCLFYLPIKPLIFPILFQHQAPLVSLFSLQLFHHPLFSGSSKFLFCPRSIFFPSAKRKFHVLKPCLLPEKLLHLYLMFLNSLSLPVLAYLLLSLMQRPRECCQHRSFLLLFFDVFSASPRAYPRRFQCFEIPKKCAPPAALCPLI